ncbi:MAG: hypothetical protein ACJAYQ_001837 [Bacteriovoracaceae bacterium]
MQDHSIKQYYKSALLFVGIVGIAFLCLELVSYFYFKNKELANTPSPDEVSTSNTAGQILNTSTTSLETFKVATFGSSETQGYGSVRNYSALLKHELEKVFPSKSVIVDTHVLEEKTFSTHQYKKVISLVKDYDLLVVSAGNSELKNLFAQKEVFRKREVKVNYKKEASELSVSSPSKIDLGRELVKYSSFFKILKKIESRIETKLKFLFKKNNLPEDKNKKFPSTHFRNEPLISKEELRHVEQQWHSSLVEVSKVAMNNKKNILFVNLMGHELWRPAFSVIEPSANRIEIISQIQRAESFLEKKKYKETFEIVSKLPSSAIVEYLKGAALFYMNHKKKAFIYLRLSMSLDPVKFRAWDSLHLISKKVASESSYVKNIDLVEYLHSFILAGFEYDDFFNDFHHYNFKGQMIIGKKIACEIASLYKKSCTPFSKSSAIFSEKEKEYLKALRVSQDEKQRAYFTQARWHSGMGNSISTYREQFRERALRAIEAFYQNSDKSPSSTIKYLIFKSLNTKDDLTLSVELLRKAKSTSLHEMEKLMLKNLNTGKIIYYAFLDKGIRYSFDTKEFKIENK